ncbi:MAG: GNAT family N-acetyltransferase [Clostridiales bacterium]|nr:GNAT family N-acetyltransferase [Clostridiales bacterium]
MSLYEIVTPLKGAVLTLQTKRLLLSVYKPCAGAEVTSYLVRNRAFHKPFQQTHSDRYYTVKEQKSYLRSDLNQYKNNSLVGLWISKIDDPGRIIGRISFYAIIGGCMNSCYVGYHIDEAEQGNGYMSECLRAGTEFMFKYYRLHRIQADILPANTRSVNCAVGCGFEKMGYNIKYMEIDGTYQDHEMYVLLNSAVET